MTTGLGKFIRIERPGVYLHWCPGCNTAHRFNISSTDHPKGNRWGWDGDLMKPSVEPELEHRDDAAGTCCNYVLRGGILLFFNNCTHNLSGKVVPLPAFPFPDRLSPRSA